MRRTRPWTNPALLALSCALAWPAQAQRAGDNAVTAAEDAFGATLGNESIGLYSSKQVRGFSPVEAGNVRMEGLYFDRQGTVPPALVEGSSIRVGLSALNYPFPAPTGIVDYRLKKAGDRRVLSVLGALNAYGAPALELDAKLPIAEGVFGVAANLSWAREEYYDGADARYLRAAVVPRWRPSEHVEVLPFWSISRGRDEEVAPVIVTAGNYLPPKVQRRRHFGQRWSDNEYDSRNYGVIAKARFGEHWALAGGVVRSIFEMPSGYAELFVDTTRDGLTREKVIADPRQRSASTSGELRVSRSFNEGPRLHVVHAAVRGRDLRSRYGGSAPALDYGWRRLGEPVPVPQPDEFAFTARTQDQVRQWTGGLAYEGRWRDRGELSLGLQRTRYEKHVDQPGLTRASTHDDLWLPNANLTAYLSRRLALYAGHTRGLEESGVAPDDAANRNQALPAIRTRQTDAGLRWTLPNEMKLVAGLFDVRKPYFITDERNVYGALGEVRHRGVELSLSGRPSDNLSLVAGAVLMRPRVSGEAVREGRVGERPIGQAERVLRTDLEYRPPALPGWSFDLAMSHYGERVASRDGINRVPAYSLADIGARYRFKLGNAPATLRLLVANVGDTYAWNLYGHNSFGLTDGRRYVVQLAVDFES
ncbi:TonB-dependent receptor [Lysobacter sp. 5GHs7-4]|uniref:TonB-dependent receptor domain-containing protein n=1 Tax=Lysobacter sp. 5GHs7-4 TaxID=2904253 RepID=UPI001E34A9FB|nr:TonB-dependent receptor [Lysobacter sp. 5GHs7-4]UHQ23696.1 TonB-dependent receptor [Lysobacter sp. 5GHs7-4]